MSRKVIINADDFGMDPAVDAAVLELNARGIVTSASVMPLYANVGPNLRQLRSQGASVGLHFDLTSSAAHGRYGTRWTLHTLIAAAWSRRLQYVRIRAMIKDQLDAFVAQAGTLPDFIDGHEHIHQFPVIREALLDVINANTWERQPKLRYTRPRHWQGSKAAIIGLLGAKRLQALGRQSGCDGNSDFAGVYGLTADAPLADLWTQWLAAMPASGGLIMCHPATHADQGAFRVNEYRYLASPAFAELLRQHDITPVPWP